MIYYVNASAPSSNGNGTMDAPFARIQSAADIALPGDEIVVFPGVYREAVNPIHAGTPNNRIIYRSLEKGAAVITGAERVTGWEEIEKDVWKVSVPNALFTDRNPYTTLVSGDWFIASFIAHTGDVYLNGKSLYEVNDLEQVRHPVKSKASWDLDFSV